MAEHGEVSTHRDLIAPSLRAVDKLGRSANSCKITGQVVGALGFDVSPRPT